MALVSTIRGHGAGRLLRLQSLISAVGGEWLRGWAIEGVGLEFGVEALELTSSSQQWLDIETAHGRVRSALPTNGLAQLGRHLTGVAVVENLGLSDGLGRRAYIDLMRLLFPGLPSTSSLRETTVPSPRELSARYGVVALSIRIGSMRFALHMDMGVVDAMVPVERRPAARLTDLAAALQDTPLELQAKLDLGQADVGQAYDLRPGEIVRTGARIDAELILCTPAGQQVARGRLVAKDGRRSIQISSMLTQ